VKHSDYKDPLPPQNEQKKKEKNHHHDKKSFPLHIAASSSASANSNDEWKHEKHRLQHHSWLLINNYRLNFSSTSLSHSLTHSLEVPNQLFFSFLQRKKSKKVM
jgi:hypothetical protein